MKTFDRSIGTAFASKIVMTDDALVQLGLPTLIDDPADQLREAVATMTGRASGLASVHLRCPSCDLRRVLRMPMARRTDRIERLLPRVPVRHWVFSLGPSAQPGLVGHPRLRTRVARACIAAVFAWLRRAAARAGIVGPVRCGAVSSIHRVDATLEANVHVHALVLDGVYTGDEPTFWPLPPPRRRDLRRMLAELRSTIASILATVTVTTRGEPRSPRPRIRQRSEAGPPARPVRSRDEASAPTDAGPPGVVQRSGELDVRAGPAIAGDDQTVRGRLCRYVARDPFDLRDLSRGSQGRLRYRLHRPFADGTTHVEFSVEQLAERLTSLATGGWRPPVGFHGVIAAAAAPRAPRGRQLSLIELPRQSARSARSAPLRCPQCRGPLDVIGVEWAERAA